MRYRFLWTNILTVAVVGLTAFGISYGWIGPDLPPVGGAGAVFVGPTGNVGFGVPTPVQKLDIAGDVRWSGSLIAGGVPWARLIDFPIGCSANQFIRQIGQLPVCASVSWLNLSGIPAGFADGVDNTGGVSSISSGVGILTSPSPITTTGSVAIDSAYIQRRVSGTCPAGQAITSITASGTVTCGSTSATPTCATSGAGRKVTAGGTCYKATSSTCNAGGVTINSSNLYVCTVSSTWSLTASAVCMAASSMEACPF